MKIINNNCSMKLIRLIDFFPIKKNINPTKKEIPKVEI